MARVLAALVLGAVSLIVVLISGISSGDVRISTIIFRSIISFCVSSAIFFFLLMAFDLYEEKVAKTLEQVKQEIATEENSEEKTEEEENQSEVSEESGETAEGFRPMNLGN